MVKRTDQKRVLIYSHDTFGLGHLRRCRAIAHALVEDRHDISVLILSGSPIIGSFEFRTRVDFVRIPGVIKLRNGDYTPLSLHIDIEDTLAMRASIIEHTAEIFDPDLFLVDKEPLGLRGEVKGTLEMLKARGTHLALGLRDVMDEPSVLAPEWERKNVVPALTRYFDSIWVYGLPQMCNPLEGISVPPEVEGKIVYTGYLRRSVPAASQSRVLPFDRPYILVTTGGGGDGEALVDWVISAYETDRNLPHPALIVNGPFMHSKTRGEFLRRAARLKDVAVITFDTNLERLMAGSLGVISMGGYNTFCEILSFDKKALLVPRTKPRLEQFIRASRADELGLMRMLPHDDEAPPAAMIKAIRELDGQKRPSEVVMPGLLDGLERVKQLVRQALGGAPQLQRSERRDRQRQSA